MRSKTGTALVALLAALLVVGAASAKSQHSSAGGTLNVDLTTDVDYTDPALSYLSTGWELEYATCLKLDELPGRQRPACEPADPGSGSRASRRSRTTGRPTTSRSTPASRSSRTVSR